MRSVSDKQELFSNIPEIKAAHIEAIYLFDTKEVAVTENLRVCTGTIVASNREEYSVKYEYKYEHGNPIIEIEIKN